jgi:hypothetical protein
LDQPDQSEPEMRKYGMKIWFRIGIRCAVEVRSTWASSCPLSRRSELELSEKASTKGGSQCWRSVILCLNDWPGFLLTERC